MGAVSITALPARMDCDRMQPCSDASSRLSMGWPAPAATVLVGIGGLMTSLTETLY